MGLAMKTRPVTSGGQPAGYLVWCPACDDSHYFRGWTFDGNHDAPTFSPSMLVRWNEGPEQTPHVCHSFLTAGVWHYLDDCTHAMRGQNVPAPEWPKPDYCGCDS